MSLLCAGLAARGLPIAVAAPPGFTLEKGNRETGKLGDASGTGQSPDFLVSQFPSFPIPLSARPHPLLDLRAASEVAGLAREYDLLHAHGLRAAWVGALAARRRRKPLVFTAHNLAPPNPGPLTRLLFRFVARRAARVICVSGAVAESLLPYGVAAEQFVVIPNGIDLAPFGAVQARADVLRAVGLPEEARVVAAIGRLSPEKGFDVLVEAAPRVLERVPDPAFVLAGEGPEHARLERLIAARGIAGRFLLPGRIEDVASLLATADAVAVPSRSEGQGIVALEAMAARRPVVASSVGGLPETVEDGVTGLLVPPDDPAALAFALVRLLTDAPLRQRLGEAGRRLAEERYTVERMVERTVEVYSGVVGRMGE